MTQGKQCYRCKIFKHVSEFYLKPNGKYHCYCRECKLEVARNYRKGITRKHETDGIDYFRYLASLQLNDLGKHVRI